MNKFQNSSKNQSIKINSDNIDLTNNELNFKNSTNKNLKINLTFQEKMSQLKSYNFVPLLPLLQYILIYKQVKLNYSWIYGKNIS